ncbi:hypothetical protein L9F63_007096, partial [Diploptera punctata]
EFRISIKRRMARMLQSSTWHKPSEIHRNMRGVYGDDCMDRSNVFRKVSARWVPKNLTDDHKGQRMMASLDHLTRYTAQGHDFLEGIVTGDESWAYHYTPETKQASAGILKLVTRWEKCVEKKVSSLKKPYKPRSVLTEETIDDICYRLEHLGAFCNKYSTLTVFISTPSGQDSLENEPHQRRQRTSITADNIRAVRDLIEEDRRVTISEIASYVGISFGSVQAVISDELKFRKLSARWMSPSVEEFMRNWLTTRHPSFFKDGIKKLPTRWQ